MHYPTNPISRGARNFTRMLEHVSGGMPHDLSSQELSRTARQCQSCSVLEMCEAWLDRIGPSDRQRPAFCPNAPGVWSQIARNQA